MPDSVTPIRVDSSIDTKAGSSAPLPVVIDDAPPRRVDAGDLDQLSRIEEKAARIEEKYARTEALLLRVEEKVEKSTSRTSELARQSDLAALRGQVNALSDRVRRVPGFASLLVLALLAAIVGAGLTVAAMHYGIPGVLPGMLPR